MTWKHDYQQLYLHKNPGGYCNHGPNGMTCPIGVAKADGRGTPGQDRDVTD